MEPPDPSAPLVGLERGRCGEGLWSLPIYRELGYAQALDRVWLREPLLARLEEAAAGLAREDAGLLVWDGWRPRELQAALWAEYRERIARDTGLEGAELDRRAREFVSPPEAGVAAHLTGAAVDLTLCDAAGAALEMGGEFDELTDRSHPLHYERDGLGTDERAFRDRRRLLHEALTGAGFWRLESEWWHFELGTARWAAATGEAAAFGPVGPPS